MYNNILFYAAWDLIKEVHEIFPQITTLMVHAGVSGSGIIPTDIKFLQLKTLHAEVRLLSMDAIKTFLAATKESFAPNLGVSLCNYFYANIFPYIEVTLTHHLQTIYLSIRNRKDKELIQQYEVLETYARSLNIKLYCRDLYLLVRDAKTFITSFQLQDLPYSYYTYENKVR